MAYSIDLSGRVAFITGASGGLGAQFARILAQAGAAVVLASRRLEKLKELRASIEGEGGEAHVVELDVTDANSISAAVGQAEREAGAIDILVNNSGVNRRQALLDVDEEAYDFIFDTNTRGAFFVAQAVARRMIARAQGAAPGTYVGGRIVNVASLAASKVLPGAGIYCMSKAAVVHMTRCMAQEWGPAGINVNALCPGYIATDINQRLWQTDAGKTLMQAMPRERVGKPEDLDALIVLLASSESHFVNGAVIAADDGFGVA
ncbi:MAG: SDR family oxidoreductase [Variovorax sp.]